MCWLMNKDWYSERLGLFLISEIKFWTQFDSFNPSIFGISVVWNRLEQNSQWTKKLAKKNWIGFRAPNYKLILSFKRSLHVPNYL